MIRTYKSQDPNAGLMYMRVKALQYNGDPHDKEFIDFIGHKPDIPHEDQFYDDRIFIQGAVGTIALYPGWYVLRALADDAIFVWKGDIFEDTYEEVRDDG